MLRGYRYRFYPDPEQEQLLRRTIGCVRLVYNKSLAECSELYRTTGKSPGYAEQDRHLTAWKTRIDLDFLNEVSCVPLQQALRHMHSARQRFFKKTASYPSFKKKGHGGSATFTRSAFRFRDGRLTLAKMSAPLDILWSRPLPVGAKPSTVTVSLDAANRWHVSLLCEDTETEKLKPVESVVGIDLGIESLVTLSTGEKVRNPRFDEESAPRKKLLSRRLARKMKGSKNREKARLKLATLNARTADRRRDYLHKLSYRLIHENQVIVVETLNVRGMVKNRNLARVISDAGWSELVRQLVYKAEWYGRTLVKVDRWLPSSKTCSNIDCGHQLAELPLSVRSWKCPACDAEHDRDVNAAKNVLAAGLAVTACGPDVRHSVLRNGMLSGMKQEISGVSPGIPLLSRCG